MGACSGCSNEKKAPLTLDKFDIEPQDTIHLEGLDLPKLYFSAQLTKVKVKRCFLRSLSLKFSITEIQQFLLPIKQFSKQTARWEVDHVFGFQMTQYEMRKKFLNISCIDSNQKTIGTLKINLYLLATGPFHQDFAIDLQTSPNKQPRLSFNFKISQIIKMEINFLQAQMISIEKEYPGDKFAFSVRSITGLHTKYTNQSYTVSVAFDQEQYQNDAKRHGNTLSVNKNAQSNSTAENSQIANQAKRLKMKSKNSIANNLRANEREVDRYYIHWSKSINQNMPSFQTEIALYDMHSSAFHIIYWKISPGSGDGGGTGAESPGLKKMEKHIYSECYVSINKLLNCQAINVTNPQSKITFEQRSIQLEHKNWIHGKQTGSSKFKVKFSIQKHIRQMQVCVRTELGVLKSSPVFSNEQGKTGSRQVNELAQLSAKIQSNFIDLARLNKQENKSIFTTRSIIKNIIELLNLEKELLKTTVKQSVLFFNYKDEKQLLKSQEQLIEIGFQTKSIINENIDEVSSVCFSLLSILMKRGQLGLSYLGFNRKKVASQHLIKSEIYKDNQSSLEPFMKKKKIIALKYQQLLNQLMILALNSLIFKGQESEQQFAQLFCALAYFQLPSFRQHVLKAINREDDPQIEEWRGTQFNLNEKSMVSFPKGSQKNTYEILFDWEKNFYSYIQDQEGNRKNTLQLESILKGNEWEGRLEKRKGAFFSFVRYWCDYVDSIALNSKHLKWKHFPGYNKILHAFLVQMKVRQLIQYSDRMEKSCVSLLHNQKLLNTFVVILFKKSDINNPPSILKLIQYLQMFFVALRAKQRLIPSTFDYNYFFKGLKIILDCSHAFSLAKTLLMIYDHFEIFSRDFKFYISMLLMGKLFFRLFLHWSRNVRLIFHHLLYIRIKKLSQISCKKTTPKGFTRSQGRYICGRYDQLMIILENASHIKKQQGKNQILKNQKDYHKRMKKKLYNRKRQKNNSQCKSSNDQDLSEAFKSLSRNPRRNTSDDYHLIEQLSKPKLERYQSEIMNTKLKLAIDSALSKKDEIIPLKSSHNIQRLSINQSHIEQEENFKDQHLDMHRITLLTEEQMQIWQMTKNETEYIDISLTGYQEIHKLLMKHLDVNPNPNSVPTVKLQMSFDYDDIRPEGVDDW